MRRLTRFRMTAEPIARLVAMPNRVVSRSVRRIRAVRSGWDRVVPRSWRAVKSCGRESITRRGRTPTRRLVRPTGAFDPEPGVRPGHGGRPRTSSGRGSRVPWRDGASWAERSASSGLRGILSIRPRGLVNLVTPGGTRTRPAPHGAWRVLRPGDDRPGPEAVSNVGRTPRNAPGRRASEGPDGTPRSPVMRYPQGVCRNRVAGPRVRCYLSKPSPPRPPSPRPRWTGSESARRPAPAGSGTHPEAPRHRPRSELADRLSIEESP